MKNLFYIIIALVLFNCGGIPKYKKENIKQLTDVKQIEGEYENYVNDTLKLFHRSINGKLNWRSKHFDSTKFTSFKLKVLDGKRLKIDFLLKNEVLKSRIIKYRFRNNGFIKLRNRNFRIAGIPFVFGEYEVQKFEIGLNKNNDLILHGIDDQGGGLLIVLSSGFTREVNTIYRRI